MYSHGVIRIIRIYYKRTGDAAPNKKITGVCRDRRGCRAQMRDQYAWGGCCLAGKQNGCKEDVESLYDGSVLQT